MQSIKLLLITLAIATGPSAVTAGPIAYALCQAGCSTLAAACYSAAGFTFGTVVAAAAPPAIIGCNTAFGSCQAACGIVALAPTL